MELSHSKTGMKSRDLCICHSLHADCDPNTCDEAAKPSNANAKRLLPKKAGLSLRDFQEAAARGCPCCSLLVNGLCIPEIKSVWNHGNVKEEDAEIELLDRRINIQVTDPERARYANLWHHFRFFSLPSLVAEPVSCSAFPVRTSLSDSTDSEVSWRNLRAWLSECDSHEACKRFAFNPKRIIDVGTREEAQPHIRLLCDVDLQGGRYVALSYCWGRSSFISTTTKTLEKRREEIAWGELPKTFQHAVTITRTLGIRYIWIDALCILQDSKLDWEIESSKMSSVYQNSYLTISATHAADTNGGCFSATPNITKDASLSVQPTSLVRIQTINRSYHHDFGHFWARMSPTSNPLPRRAWALQERLLSPRTVHYLATELVWECNTIFDCQCGGIHVMNDFKPTYIRSLQDKDNVERTRNWIWILEVYTSLSLTKRSDHLPALSGLARQAQEAGWGRYIAGFWRNELEYLTCWEIKDQMKAERSSTYLGPSWSWVNVVGPITYAGYIRESFRENTQILIEIKEVDAQTGIDPTGSVLDAYLRISGRCLDASLSENNKLTTMDGDVYEEFIPDMPISVQDELRVKLVPWCLTADDTGGHLLVMVLLSAKERVEAIFERSGAYERLGILRVKEEGSEFRDVQKFAWWVAAKAENIYLV